MTKYVSNDLWFSKQNFLNEFNFLWKLLLVNEKAIIKVYWKILKPGREYSRMDEVERARERERESERRSAGGRRRRRRRRRIRDHCSLPRLLSHCSPTLLLLLVDIITIVFVCFSRSAFVCTRERAAVVTGLGEAWVRPRAAFVFKRGGELLLPCAGRPSVMV